MKYYTKRGDDGNTILPNGKISKDSNLINIVGDIDELNSLFGLIVNYIDDEYINNIIKGIQDRFFNIGAEIIMQNSKVNKEEDKKSFNFSEQNITDLETVIDEIGAKLPELNKFILPGGSESAAWLHYTRAVVRRVERNFVKFSKKQNLNPNILKYINRLSSFFFVAARYMNQKEGVKEINPTYTR